MSQSRCYGCGEPDESCRCTGAISITLPGLSDQHRRWLARRMAVDSADDEYASNFRIARVGNPEDEQAYAAKKEHGCCGSTDSFVKHPDGTVFAVGWNYGH